MRFWWVNHGVNGMTETANGYLWSPTAKANGGQLFYWSNMIRAEPGDLVISYFDTAVQAVGIVQARAHLFPKPATHAHPGNNWSDLGWRLTVKFVRFPFPLRTMDHAALIAPVLPSRYSPLKSDGGGNLGYLFEATPDLIDIIGALFASDWDEAISKLRDEVGLVIDDTELTSIELVEKILERSDKSETEREQLVMSRVGQGRYRENVLLVEKSCRITGVDAPTHLRASHIKPWRLSADDERLDGENGLMLSPHVDHLFDNGFISFKHTGEILVAQNLPTDIAERWRLNLERPVGSFTAKQRQYLEFHRDKLNEGRY